MDHSTHQGPYQGINVPVSGGFHSHGVPPGRWMVDFMENNPKCGWFAGTPISGNPIKEWGFYDTDCLGLLENDDQCMKCSRSFEYQSFGEIHLPEDVCWPGLNVAICSLSEIVPPQCQWIVKVCQGPHGASKIPWWLSVSRMGPKSCLKSFPGEIFNHLSEEILLDLVPIATLSSSLTSWSPRVVSWFV